MAGRGRGSAFAFTAEVLGLGRGADAIPASIVQPPPLFPPLEYKPVPLATGEDLNYMLLLKQEFRGTMKDSAFCIKPAKQKKDVERYSDKYQNLGADDEWTPSWDMFPKELNFEKKAIAPKRRSNTMTKPEKRVSRKALQQVEEKLKILEKKETEEGEEKKEETKEGEEQNEDSEAEVEEDFYEEEEMEEGTDYIVSYFDPGDDFIDADEGNDDGPIY